MKTSTFIPVIFILLFSLSLRGQTNKFTRPYQPPAHKITPNLLPLKPFPLSREENVRNPNPIVLSGPLHFNARDLKVKKNGYSIWVEGKITRQGPSRDKPFIPDYLMAIKPIMHIKEPSKEFQLSKKEIDKLGFTHHKMIQFYEGVEVFGGEVIMHEKNGEIISMNGVVFPTPDELSVEHQSISASEAIALAYADLNKQQNKEDAILDILHLSDEAQLKIYYKNGVAHLIWKVSLYPDHLSHWQFFIDAQSQKILEKINGICMIHGHHHGPAFPTNLSENDFNPTMLGGAGGPESGTGLDLLGQSRTVHSFEDGGVFYLIDASRSMFKSIGTDTEQPSGVIMTLDSDNVAPGKMGYSGNYITSTSKNWDNPKAVSAHYNAGIAFEYFQETFGRNSINGKGGNILSFINIVDEQGASLDNAFWNGAAMFYGNGGGGFTELAAALDVAGHEMSHGVIQNTAGLVYMNESGALNESYADIFGVLIDRDDWQLGEQVVKNEVFRSGALRDMADPHNGGFSLQDNGWQPRTMSEKYNGSEDNGGVHINSGIHNWAFFKVATNIGKDKAEKIFFRALSNYLTRSSNFIDARNATIKSAEDIHGPNSQEVQVVRVAFDEVGILEGTSTNTQEDINQNPGQDIIAYINSLDDKISIVLPDGSSDIQNIVNFLPLSRPSVTDDGSAMVYVSTDNIMRYILFDWAQSFETGNLVYELGTIEDSPSSIWRNVVISKDGNKIAALTAEEDNLIYVYDYNLGEWNTFELYNPTFTEGVTTGDVLRADAMEFDHSGTYLMYDAENLIRNNSGADITFWDIGFLSVSQGNGWGDGSIQKLVTGLPENVSIGNPTFAKNSPFIIAFDYLEELIDPFFGPYCDYFVYGVNIETGEFNSILNGTRIGFPSYSPDDQYIMFNSQSDDIFGTTPTLFAAPLNPDKISFADVGDFIQFKQDAYWSNWFATGQRELLSTSLENNALAEFRVEVFPNPVDHLLQLQLQLDKSEDVYYEVFNLLGQSQFSQNLPNVSGAYSERINMRHLTPGVYSLIVEIGNQRGTYKIMKR
ncbi:MAG: T9SS type A sorting domain-containing protein [Saprospiraceae bacterium]|nr:T9SS type A sorting domain-containing protein [Saprospiraceae bacterium]